MYKLTVAYGLPADPEAFDRHYRDVHIPLAKQIPGIAHWTITKCDPTPDGAPASSYLVAELWGRDRASLLGAFATPQGVAAAQDVSRFADGGAQFLYGDEKVVTTSDAFWTGR
jgi:uncharacterized protein (TIGR02118 family)